MQAAYPALHPLLNIGASTLRNGAVTGFEASERPAPIQPSHPAVHTTVQAAPSAGPPEPEPINSKSKRTIRKPFRFCFILSVAKLT